MEDKTIDLGKLPMGFTVIKFIYAFTALLSAFLAVIAIHNSGVIYLEIKLSILPSILINTILILFPLVLYFGFSRPTAMIWYLAFLYHIFFIGNSFLGILSIFLPASPIVPVLESRGVWPYAPTAIESFLPISLKLFSIFDLTILLGIFILWYLWQKREYFMPKKLLENL